MLTATGLRKTFNAGTSNARTALDGVSLRLDTGDFAVVIGGNGAGKSTMLNAIAGEVIVDEGSLNIDGREVTDLPTHRRAGLVSRVFQDPLAGSAGPMTIEENMAIAARRGQSSRMRFALGSGNRAVYREMLRVFGLGLEDRLNHKVELLSGGQRQALALSMAIITAPKVLLLDEHCAALDPKTAECVMQATISAVQRKNLTAVMVTHNMQHAIDFGNRLVMMMNGRIVFEARDEEKKKLTIEQLVERFHLVDDKMLLA